MSSTIEFEKTVGLSQSTNTWLVKVQKYWSIISMSFKKIDEKLQTYSRDPQHALIFYAPCFFKEVTKPLWKISEGEYQNVLRVSWIRLYSFIETISSGYKIIKVILNFFWRAFYRHWRKLRQRLSTRNNGPRWTDKFP